MDDRSRNRLLGVLFVGVLMGALDIAIVGPALPAIRETFGIDGRAAAWIFSVYVLFNLVSAPFMAKLSDRYGRRGVYLLDVALFAAGSLVVAVAPTYALLLVGRALQAIGAGGIFPVASAVIGDTFPADKRGRALGLIGAVFGLAFLVGPLLGGLLLRFGWEWLFLINLPIAAWLLFAGARLVPSSHPESSPPFDWAGAATLSLALGSLALGLGLVDTDRLVASLTSWPVGPLLLVALVALPVLLGRRAPRPDPIVRPHLLRPLQVRLTVAFAAGAGLSEAAMVFLPSLAVATLGVSTATASFLLLPLVLALAVGSPTVGRLLDAFGSKLVVMAGLVLTAIGLVTFGVTAGSMTGYVLASIATGLGLSALLGAPLRYILLNEATEADRGASQGLLTVFTSMGQLVGAALIGATVASTAGAGGFERALIALGVLMGVLALTSLGLKDRARERAERPAA